MFSTRIDFTLFNFSSLHKRSIKSINDKSTPVSFAGDSDVIFINSNLEAFKNYTKIEFKSLNRWIKANRQLGNFDTIQFLQFTPKNSLEMDVDIRYVNKLIPQEQEK